MSMTRETISRQLNELLVEQFEVDPDSLNPDALLFDDLGIDSIDAVDLIIQLKELTGERIPPEQFKNVKTLGDVVEVVQSIAG